MDVIEGDMKRCASLAVLLALCTTTLAQTNNDVTALQGLQSCIQANKATIPYVNGWGVGLSAAGTAAAGRKLLQTADNCAAAAAISSAIPCTPTATSASTTATGTPPTAGSPPGTTTTPSGIPTGTSTTNPCGDASNPVPWTGLLCTDGRVTSVLMSQLGPNVFKGTCDLSNLTDLAGLSAAVNVDFTNAGVSGSVPAAWGTGAWSSTLQSLVLAQNVNVTGAIPDLSGLSALQSLELSNASFTGPINLNASGFQSLKSFTAFNNKLEGPLPTALPVNLTTLGVGGNQINGTLPAYNSSTLGTFQVNNNLLTGCLPSAWASGLQNITNIDLSNNQLSGPIPESWQASGAFPTLQTINIVGNQLCGSLGQLGTPVNTVGQNNPSATRLVPDPGSLPACSGTSNCA